MTEAMADLAASFVRGMAAEGEHFSFEPDDAVRLDAVCDRVLADRPPADLVHSVVVSMGAYLGELLVKHGSAHWVDDVDLGPGVLMPNGLQGYPLTKVHKRLTRGPEHSLAAFYRYSMTRDTGPDDDVRVLPN